VQTSVICPDWFRAVQRIFGGNGCRKVLVALIFFHFKVNSPTSSLKELLAPPLLIFFCNDRHHPAHHRRIHVPQKHMQCAYHNFFFKGMCMEGEKLLQTHTKVVACPSEVWSVANTSTPNTKHFMTDHCLKSKHFVMAQPFCTTELLVAN